MTSEDRREQLLCAGGQLLADRPYDELSIDDIARAAGISKGLLYHYFPTKRDFLIALLSREADRVTELTAPDPRVDPPEQIDAGLDAFLDYVSARATGWSTLFRTRGGGDAEIRAVLEQARERRIAVLIGSIGAWFEDPAAAHDSPVLRSAVQGWTFFVEGILLRWLDRRDMERADLRELLRCALTDAVATATRLDPALRLADPSLSRTGAGRS